MPFLYQSSDACSPSTTFFPRALPTDNSSTMFRGTSLKDKLFRRKSSKNGNLSPTGTSNSPSSTAAPPYQPRFPSNPNPSPPTRRPGTTTATLPIRTMYNSSSSKHTEAPPAYTAPATPTAAQGTDSRYAFLSHFDTIFLIDDSGSMSGSRWRETSAAISAIAPICTTHDSDGIDIHFLNTPDQPGFCNLTSADAVRRVFESVRPGGGTPTGMRIHQILRPYLANLLAQVERGRSCEDVKPLNIIVITDGEAGDDVETPIKAAASKLERMDAPGWQVGIQFFQVGNDQDATKALQELDDELAEDGVRDIVDTVPWSGASGRVGLDGDGILKVVLGAVNRKLDRKRISLDSLRR